MTPDASFFIIEASNFKKQISMIDPEKMNFNKYAQMSD